MGALSLMGGCDMKLNDADYERADTALTSVHIGNRVTDYLIMAFDSFCDPIITREEDGAQFALCHWFPEAADALGAAVEKAVTENIAAGRQYLDVLTELRRKEAKPKRVKGAAA